MTVSIRSIDSFGKSAAENENQAALLSYFLTTDAVRKVESNEAFLVIGKKGAGKTALMRYFRDGAKAACSSEVNLAGYLWKTHAKRRTQGGSELEAYIATWKYLIAVEFCQLVVVLAEGNHTRDVEQLKTFLKANYGTARANPNGILNCKKKIRITGVSSPSVLGNSIGGISLDREDGDTGLAHELDELTRSLFMRIAAIVKANGIQELFLHFDQLDKSLEGPDSRNPDVIKGLILAADLARRELLVTGAVMNPVVYIRSDIWDTLEFSDANKAFRDLTVRLEWDSTSLRSLVEHRIHAKLHEQLRWEDIVSSSMQDDVASWDYIVELSRFRPRDIIVLLSFALPQAKARHDNPLLFEDNDFHKSLDEYADYLRREINDEIFTHWPKWQEALTACFDVIYCTGVFERTQFASAYEARRTVQNAVSSDNALKELYKFSVIGFNCLTGIEEASWVFSHQPRSQWDSRACVFKINEGLRRIVPTRTAGSILQRVLESNRHVSYKQDIPLGVITLPHFVVNQNVLRPEVVTSFYLARFLACNTNLFKDAKVVDMGSGSGIQGIVMALLGAKHVFLTDVSPASVENSQFNADLYDLGSATTVVQGDLFSGLCDRVDLIVFNHPFFQGNPAETDLIGRAIQDPGDLIHRFFDDARKFAPRIVMPFLHAAGKTNDPGVQAPKHGYSIAKQHRLRSTLILNPGDVSIYELEYSGG